ncbi:MAG: tyrosine-type recombinase/integrase [Streptosporangiaceae bacterium]|jgi:integrase
MTGLRQALAGYLDLRRGMGFKLDRDAKLLAQFISYLEQAGSVTVTAADALAWATLPAGASPGWLAFRMSVARGFAAYLRTLDPAAEIIPPGLLPGGSHRAVPYLYSAADISALLAQAERLRTPLRTATIQALIGLLAVTGMRIGEALALDDGDFDAGQGMLIVRHAKFGKRRLLPLHQTTVTALQSYQGLRGQVFPRPCSDALLVSSTGDRLRYVNVSQTFVRLARRAGLAARSGGCRPRPHDLRHSFAVATLLDWYRDGGDVASRLPLLSAYLGHVEPANTYWYLHAAPELLAEAARRLGPGPGARP